MHNLAVDIIPPTHDLLFLVARSLDITGSHIVSHVTGGTFHTIALADLSYHYGYTAKYTYLQLKQDYSNPAETTYS